LLTLEQFAELFGWLNTIETDAATAVRLIAAVETHFLHKPPSSDTELMASIANLYADRPDSPLHDHLPRVLAALAGPAELTLLAELLASDPPSSAESCALALSPLLRRPRFDAAPLFPRLLDCLANPQVAAAALDTANYVTRQQFVASHPAADRSQELAALLGEITGRLTSISEEGDAPTAESVAQVREGIGLVVALCDALGQIGDASAVGKLRQALAIMHRRVHTEAACALARLGEAEGEELLIELAAEPVARLRVLAYASELRMLEKIDEEYQTPVARAEAELAAWLAEPMQMGMPPHRIELVDQREQYWPSYDDPVECFLFHYTYEFPGGELSNVGIAGPMVMGFSADLSGLPVESIYAAFAGWQAEHEDIYELPVDSLSGQAARQAEQLASRLTAEGFSSVTPHSLGHFFEQRVLIAEARREGVLGIATIDDESLEWRPTEGPRPLGAAEVYAIYKGKRLLETFNA